MRLSRARKLVWIALVFTAAATAQGTKPNQSAESSSSKHTKGSARLVPDIDAGSVANGVYRNLALRLTCKIPTGWVLRTDEMNAREEESEPSEANGEKSPHFSQSQGEVGHPSGDKPSLQGNAGEDRGRVLLAAFSRPPEARGEDVNSSLVIAVEKTSTYPGLTDAAQYFGPLTDVAKAQGFVVDEEPYEMEIGSKVVVRGDFHKDVGSRVMRQSTLAFLAQGYAVSITAIGGTEDEVEELIDAVGFGAGK